MSDTKVANKPLLRAWAVIELPNGTRSVRQIKHWTLSIDSYHSPTPQRGVLEGEFDCVLEEVPKT